MFNRIITTLFPWLDYAVDYTPRPAGAPWFGAWKRENRNWTTYYLALGDRAFMVDLAKRKAQAK